MYKRPFYQIVELNRVEKSIRQRESNRIEFFLESECSTFEPLCAKIRQGFACCTMSNEKNEKRKVTKRYISPICLEVALNGLSPNLARGASREANQLW